MIQDVTALIRLVISHTTYRPPPLLHVLDARTPQNGTYSTSAYPSENTHSLVHVYMHTCTQDRSSWRLLNIHRISCLVHVPEWYASRLSQGCTAGNGSWMRDGSACSAFKASKPGEVKSRLGSETSEISSFAAPDSCMAGPATYTWVTFALY